MICLSKFASTMALISQLLAFPVAFALAEEFSHIATFDLPEHTISVGNERKHIHFSPDGRFLAIGGDLIDLSRKAHLGPLRPNQGSSTSICFAPDSRRFLHIFVDECNLLRVKDVEQSSNVKWFGDQAKEYNDDVVELLTEFPIEGNAWAAFTNDNAILYAWYNGKLTTWKFDEHELQNVISYEGEGYVVPTDINGTVLLVPFSIHSPCATWDGKSLVPSPLSEPQYHVQGQSRGLRRVRPRVLSGRGMFVELVKNDSESVDGTFLDLRDLKSGERRQQLKLPKDTCCFDATARGDLLVLGRKSGTIELRDWSGKVIESLKAVGQRPGFPELPIAAVCDVACSEDGMKIAALHSGNLRVSVFHKGPASKRADISHAYFPLQSGNRWYYSCELDRLTHLAVITGQTFVGGHECAQLEWYRLNEATGQKDEQPYAIEFIGVEDRAVMQFGSSRGYFAEARYSWNGIPLIPQVERISGYSEGAAYDWDRGTVQAQLRTHSVTEPVPTAGNLETIKAELSDFEANGPRSVVYAENVGPVRIISVREKRVLELKRFVPHLK